MQNFVKDGAVLAITAPEALSSGEVVVVGAIRGVAIAAAASGATAQVATEGVFTVAKEAPLVIDEGDLVYWDTTADEADKTNTNEKLGVCVADAASSDTTVQVKLLPGWN